MFVNLHRAAFTFATFSCIYMNGGPDAFDFKRTVMFFALTRRESDNPGNAFAIDVAECVPYDELGQLIPDIKKNNFKPALISIQKIIDDTNAA